MTDVDTRTRATRASPLGKLARSGAALLLALAGPAVSLIAAGIVIGRPGPIRLPYCRFTAPARDVSLDR